MRKTVIIILGLYLCMSCDEPGDSGNCVTPATVRDLTGLDGCGIVFELDDGSRLEPVRIGWCRTPPLPDEGGQDPLSNFELIDGRKVFISYELSTSPSICMVGQTVKITCIREAPHQDENPF